MSQRQSPIYTPAGGPPQGDRPSPLIFHTIGEEGCFGLLADLYERLEQSSVRHLFPEDMQLASQRSAAFFVQLLGGPPLFNQQFGPPRMRQRHMPFEIDEEAREVWLACFEQALCDAPLRHGFPEEHLPGFRDFLRSFSGWMVNHRPNQG
jgi:hemoglobin